MSDTYRDLEDVPAPGLDMDPAAHDKAADFAWLFVLALTIMLMAGAWGGM